jgi:hypothetical protein
MARNNNQLKLAEALREFEVNGTLFTADMIVEQTTFSKNSVNKYINEKLLDKYVFHAGSRTKYRCEGLLDRFLCVFR